MDIRPGPHGAMSSAIPAQVKWIGQPSGVTDRRNDAGDDRRNGASLK
jgi:hypothetical protein